MKWTKLLNFILNITFGSLIIFLAIKGLVEAPYNKRFVRQTFSSFENYWAKRSIKINMSYFRSISIEVLFFQNFLLLFGGLLLIFNQNGRRFFLSMGIILQFTLLHNPLLFSQRYVIHFLKLLSILGGTLYL